MCEWRMSGKIIKKTKHPRGFLTKEGALRVDIKLATYKERKHKIKLYVYQCLGCSKEIKLLSGSLRTHTGRCESCCQRGLPYEATYNELVNRYGRHKHEINLTYLEFLEFTKIKNCHYCHKDLEWKPFTKINGEDVEGGRAYKLDRKDNDLSYSPENCVTCCWKCNVTKGNRYTYELYYEMAAPLRRINASVTNSHQ